MENVLYERDITTVMEPKNEEWSESNGWGGQWKRRVVIELTEEVNGYVLWRTDVDRWDDNYGGRKLVEFRLYKSVSGKHRAIEAAVELGQKIQIEANDFPVVS